jgi:hypothetical protein
MLTNLRLWTIGQHVGGALHRIEECPCCKLPGAQWRTKRQTFVHSFELTGEAFEPLDTCRLSRQAVEQLESRRSHAKSFTS